MSFVPKGNMPPPPSHSAMRLRHFSSGLKPVFVDQAISGTYVDEARRQLSLLSTAVGQDEADKEQLLDAFVLAAGKWGQQSISRELDVTEWVSNVSNDHTPFEYSVALEHKTGDAELRFLIEAQPESNDLLGAQESAQRLNDAIAEAYKSTVSFHRWSTLQDLFTSSQPQGMFAAWHSCAASKAKPEWKIYLNPSVGGASSSSIVSQAFGRLGMTSSWELLQSTMKPNDSVLYFSLDLSSDPKQARVKVYLAHPNAYAYQIAQKHAQICPNADAYEIQQFCSIMADGSLGPYEAKPLLSCFAFTSAAPHRPVGTVHFPVIAYAENDAVLQERMRRYIDLLSLSPLYQDRYSKIVSAVQRRPLEEGKGIHAWISLKQGAEGRRTNTFYLSPELYGAL